MPWTEINNIGIAYEIIGDGARRAAITPGGRYSKDTPGIRDLAHKLAEGGYKVLIWDRPNTGASDLCFDGPSESAQNADLLGALLRALDFGSTYLIGGSGGARDSMLCGLRNPDVVERLFVLWISGGAIGLATLPFFYCADSANTAANEGMEAVVELPSWREQIARNPGNRDRLLKWEPFAFAEKMQSWAWAYFPKEGSPMPGLTPADLGVLRIPVMILRSSRSDMFHTRETSETVHRMIPGSQLAEPPWGEHEWAERLKESSNGFANAPFKNWPLLALQILAFGNS